MRIAIIGPGHVGKTLGTALQSKGHTVTCGSRDPANSSGAELPSRTAKNKAAISPSSSPGAKMTQTAMPTRALGWVNPNP
jgi:predicted dinucleotide-binding enzyme